MVDPQELREAALRRLQQRREFGTHLASYVVFNAMLVVVWFFTGHGYFWPVWVIAGWGVGLVLHAWEVFGRRRPITEDDIRREMERLGGAHH